MEFEVFNTNYKFDDSHHVDIPNYNWFMNFFKTGLWESDTFQVFENLKDVNSTALDIGSWIGPTTIWLSRNFKKVISVEPDTTALFSLKNNLIGNDCQNVDIIEKVVFNNSKNKIFFGKNLKVSEGHGDSTSQSKLDSISEDDYEVETITYLEILNQNPDITFVKIDIEGGEEFILEDVFLNSEGKTVWISFHYNWWQNQDTDRFSVLLVFPKSIMFKGQQIEKRDFFELVKQNPFGSFLIEF